MVGYKEWRTKRKMKKAGVEVVNGGGSSKEAAIKIGGSVWGATKSVGRGLSIAGQAVYEHEKKHKTGRKVGKFLYESSKYLMSEPLKKMIEPSKPRKKKYRKRRRK